MAKKITQKQLLELIKKIKNGVATPEEKTKILKELNLSIEEINKLLEALISEMKNKLEKV